MVTEKNMISIEPYLKDFKQYLGANTRCMLSAKFGDGKSYFISRFIQKYKKNYLFIPIYPVNYQVMENKDIFELIKRDILIKLLSNENININQTDLNVASLLFNYFIDKPKEAISELLSLIPAINILGVELNLGCVIENIDKIEKKFEEHKKQFESVDKKSEVYITEFNNLKGSIYEFDVISQLICDVIHNYKKNNLKREVVLVIEDIDRMDPAHLFRILNVFSAHFDRYAPSPQEFDVTCGDNKFCFDKIITICDIDNIRNIYSHVYGNKTDFWGYIGKFINNHPFQYSLKSEMTNYIIENLLNLSLKKHAVLCERLVRLILNHVDSISNLEYNLRIIKERILKSESRIKNYSIPLEKGLSGLFLYSYADFTQLLALLKTFEIEFGEFTVRDDAGFRECMACLVGPFWALLENVSTELSYDLNGLNMICFLNKSNIYGDNFATALSFKTEEEIITDITIRFDDRNGIGLEIYKNLNLIAEYLLKNVII